MGPVRKTLLFLVFFVTLGLIVLTWGSVGSAVLTLAMIIALGFAALTRFLDTHDPDDYRME